MARRSPEEKKLDKQLFKAAARGDVAEMEKLVEQGARIETRSSELLGQGRTVLHKAVCNDQLHAAEFLLKKGADIETVSQLYMTPLLDAVENRNADMVRLLLAHGASTVTRNYDGRNALALARHLRADDVVTVLRKHAFDQEVATAAAARKWLEQSRPQPEPQPPEMEDTLTIQRSIGDLVLQETFNFAGRERITFARRGRTGPVEGMTRQNFSDIDDKASLRAAFAQYAQNGGTIPEEEVFPETGGQTLDKPAPDKAGVQKPQGGAP